MTIPPLEQKIRQQLAVARWMQAYLPLKVEHWLLKQGVARAQLPAGVTRQAVLADGVPGDWLIPANQTSPQVLLYLHGGGFVLGQTPLHLQMGAYLAQKMGRRVLMVDYRLAPEFPYPAALEDCVTTYRWLLKQGLSAQEIVVAGDSAGGNLTLTTLMKLRANGDPLPAAAACLSPVTDLSNKEHPAKDYNDPVLPPQAVVFYNKSYLGHSDPRNPLISPVFGDWRGLPPLLVHVGEDELLREDAVRVAELAQAAGVEARLEIYPRMWHVWQIFLALPQATQSLDEIAHFLTSHLA